MPRKFASVPIYVFDVPHESEKPSNDYLPYNADLSQSTLDSLKNISFLDETVSSRLVNEILLEKEHKDSELISAEIYNIDKIRQSWLDCQKRHYEETIRNVQSINVILYDIDDNQNSIVIPADYETLSIYKWTLVKWIKQLESENPDFEGWFAAKADLSESSQFDFDWEDENYYHLRRIDSSELKDYDEVVFISNKFFAYTDAGLIKKENSFGYCSPKKYNEDKEQTRIQYKKDTFFEHNSAMINCYEKEFKPSLEYLYKKLDKRWNVKQDWDKLIKATICFHDYGKLNESWQKPMLDFQRRKIKDDTFYEILAHTDYDEDDYELAKQCKIYGKPPHAGIGAVQAFEALNQIYGDNVACALSCAIMRHHDVSADSSVKFKIQDLSEIAKLLKTINLECTLLTKGEKESLLDLVPENDREWLLYFVIVRILRLCDQKATSEIDKYIER